MPLLRLFLDLLGSNWRAIVLSVMAATTFWFFNALNKSYSTRLNYPLDFSFARDSVVVVDPLPDKIVVDVSGGGWNLMRKTFLFSATPILLELDNPTEIKFFTRASLLPEITEQLGGISLDYVVTDTLFINIEPKEEKRVRVIVDSLSIPLRRGHRVTSEISIRPDSVLITGPKSMIDTLDVHYVTTFSRRNLESDFNDEFEIEYETNLLRSSPEEVRVRFDVDRFNRDVISIPLEANNFPGDSSVYLRDSVIQIHYTVRTNDASKVAASDFSIITDFTMLNEADSSISPILTAFPSFVSELDFEPDTLKVVYAN